MKYRYTLFLLFLTVAAGAACVHLLFSLSQGKPVPLQPSQTLIFNGEEDETVVVWYYTETFIDGRLRRWDRAPQGIAASVTHYGEPVSLRLDQRTTMSVGDGERRSLLTFRTETGGPYKIRIEDAPEGMLFAVGPSFPLGDFFAALGLGMVSALLFILTIALFILALTNTLPGKRGRERSAD